jgi:hypothetical protein
MLKESLSHSRVWESNPQDFTEQAQSRKVVQLEKIKIVIILLKLNAQGKGMILIGFHSYCLMVLVVRPGYRIGRLSIKRGSRVSNLIVSFGESSNLCILGIIFLGSYLFYPCELLELVVISMTSSSSSKMVFCMKHLLCFWCLEVLPVRLCREVKPFIIWF